MMTMSKSSVASRKQERIKTLFFNRLLSKSKYTWRYDVPRPLLSVREGGGHHQVPLLPLADAHQALERGLP